MLTKILNIDKKEIAISAAVEELNNSNVIAFPTETVYGIGCSIFDEEAIKKIYSIKNRDFAKPLGAYISNINQVYELCVNIPDDFFILSEKFLPGPLTIVLEKKSNIFDSVTAKLGTIGLRYSNNIILNEIISRFGMPLAGSSANISGSSSLSDAMSVYNELNGKIPLIIDAGTSKIGRESTVVSLAFGKISFIRIGAIPREEIMNCLDYNSY